MNKSSNATTAIDASAGRIANSLDEVDHRILAELRRDGRLSITALAERVHISRAGAYARVERLTRDRVITGFSAHVDPVRAGLGTSAYITMTVRQADWRELRNRLQAIPEIHHIALLGGDFDVLLLVRTRDNSALRTLVLDVLADIPGVLGTRTLLIFEEVQAGAS